MFPSGDGKRKRDTYDLPMMADAKRCRGEVGLGLRWAMGDLRGESFAGKGENRKCGGCGEGFRARGWELAARGLGLRRSRRMARWKATSSTGTSLRHVVWSHFNEGLPLIGVWPGVLSLIWPLHRAFGDADSNSKMDALLDARFQRVEAALTTLIDSIASYNPSQQAVVDLVAADDDLSRGLQQRASRPPA